VRNRNLQNQLDLAKRAFDNQTDSSSNTKIISDSDYDDYPAAREAELIPRSYTNYQRNEINLRDHDASLKSKSQIRPSNLRGNNNNNLK
jgi:hypothetical protein